MVSVIRYLPHGVREDSAPAILSERAACNE